MIFNSTYTSKKNLEATTELVGKRFSFLERLKLNGIGSKRMMIEKVSLNLRQYVNTIADISYANIELRPNGILIHINKGLQTFTWVLPYYQLVIYKTNGSSIHGQGKFINFKQNMLLNENRNFFKKMMDLKIKYDANFESPTMTVY